MENSKTKTRTIIIKSMSGEELVEYDFLYTPAEKIYILGTTYDYFTIVDDVMSNSITRTIKILG